MRQSAVTPEEVGKYYAGHQSEFEETRIYQVGIRKKPEGAKEGIPGLLAEEAKTRAEEIRKAMISGEDPKKLAERFQLPNVVRVDAEPFPVRRGAMRPEMEKAAFELKEGEVSEVFDTPQSLVFFKVASRKVRELADVSSQIGNTLQKQKVDSAVDDLKKNTKVWLDDGYFSTPIQPAAQGAAKPQVLPGAPATPK
jgi:hypothetical protein